MSVKKGLTKVLITAAAMFLLTTPVLAGHGPADGTGNDGDGLEDGTGYGPGDCTTVIFHLDDHQLLVRGGNGNGGDHGNGGDKGGYGPGDGTGNDGDGPKDGTGNGPGTGDCVNS
jgi:hypothetical protein